MKNELEANTGMQATGIQYTQMVTQQQLDECSRAMGRPLFDFEVRVLDDVLSAQARVNKKLAKMGELGRTHSLDEVVHVFTDRLRKLDSHRLAEKMLKDFRA